MSEIHFQTDEPSHTHRAAELAPRIVTLLVQKGIVSNEQQAYYVLAGLAALFAAIALAVWHMSSGSISTVDTSRLTAPPPSVGPSQ